MKEKFINQDVKNYLDNTPESPSRRTFIKSLAGVAALALGGSNIKAEETVSFEMLEARERMEKAESISLIIGEMSLKNFNTDNEEAINEKRLAAAILSLKINEYKTLLHSAADSGNFEGLEDIEIEIEQIFDQLSDDQATEPNESNDLEKNKINI